MLMRNAVTPVLLFLVLCGAVASQEKKEEKKPKPLSLLVEKLLEGSSWIMAHEVPLAVALKGKTEEEQKDLKEKAKGKDYVFSASHILVFLKGNDKKVYVHVWHDTKRNTKDGKPNFQKLAIKELKADGNTIHFYTDTLDFFTKQGKKAKGKDPKKVEWKFTFEHDKEEKLKNVKGYYKHPGMFDFKLQLFPGKLTKKVKKPDDV